MMIKPPIHGLVNGDTDELPVDFGWKYQLSSKGDDDLGTSILIRKSINNKCGFYGLETIKPSLYGGWLTIFNPLCMSW